MSYRPMTCSYVCVMYVLYDSWVIANLSMSVKTVTTIPYRDIQLDNIDSSKDFLHNGTKTIT